VTNPTSDNREASVLAEVSASEARYNKIRNEAVEDAILADAQAAETPEEVVDLRVLANDALNGYAKVMLSRQALEAGVRRVIADMVKSVGEPPALDDHWDECHGYIMDLRIALKGGAS
jgi:hypothetical protein